MTAEGSPPRSLARRRSAVALTVFVGALAAAFLGHADRGHATFAGLEAPPCPMRAVLGERACPGCGLTRATVLAAHGDLRDAVAVHPAGPVVLVLCVLGALLHADVLRRGARGARHDAWRRRGRIVFVVALIAGAALRAAGVAG